MGLSMKLVFTLIIQLCPCFAAEVSKACFGVQGLPCTKHSLNCNRSHIFIQEAFYKVSSFCPSYGINNCANMTSIRPTGERYNFSDSKLDSLYGSCSTKSTCSLQAIRQNLISFSAILYQCINETINMCNVISIPRTDTSLIYRGPSNQNTCECSISKAATRENTVLTLTALDLRRHCQAFHLSKAGITVPIPCTKITSKQLIFNSTDWEDVKMTVNAAYDNTFIWIKIQATGNVNIVCNEKSTTENAESTTSLTTKRPKTSSTTSKQGTTRTLRRLATSKSSLVLQPHQTTVTEIRTDAESNTGTVVGIIVPLCIIITGVVIAVIIIRRRKLRQKGDNGKVVKPEPNRKEVYSLEKKFSPEYDYATTNEYLDLVPQTHTMQSPQYVSARNISKIGKESQQTKKGSSDYDYTGGDTYHVLERQSALRDSSDYDYAGGNDYHEVEPRESNTSDYDYATCGDKQSNHSSSRNTQTRDRDYDHFGRQPARANRHYDNTLSVACPSKGRSASEEVYSYNHLNEKAPSNVDADSTYNTTSSTRHKMDSSTNDMEDHYGYNHLGTESKKDLPQNEYDTTASAIRDLARRNGDMEDPTYDHAHLITSDCSPSGMINAGFTESDYDHASTTTAHKDECESNASPNRSHQEEGVADVYTIAGEADTNPYQLAK